MGSANYNRSKINADHAAVSEQSGIFAGDGGYRIDIGGHSELIGGLITSTAAAEAQDRNRFSTATLSARDLHNHSHYEGSSIGLSGGMSIGGGDVMPEQIGGMKLMQMGQQTSANTVQQSSSAGSDNGNSIGYGEAQDRQHSRTYSGINTANLHLGAAHTAPELRRDINTEDAQGSSGALINRFDAQSVQASLDLQRDISQEFSRTRGAVRQLINTKVEAAEQSGDKQQAAQLQKLGVALDMLASGLFTPNGNGLIGSIANTGAPLLTYQLGQIAKAKQVEGSTAHIGAHAALAALTAALGDNDPLAAALSAGGSEAAIPLIAQTLYGTQDPAKLSSAEKSQLADIAQLIGAGIGGIAGGGNTAVATAADAGRRAVEGNYLNVPEAQRRNALLEKYAWLDSRAQRAWYQSVGTEEEKAAIYEYLQIENLDRSRNVEFNKAYDNCRINADCEKFHYLHVTQRTLWNAPGIELFKEDMRNNNIDSNWEKYPDSKNAFHNFSEDGKSVARNADGTFVNTKYIHRNGQYEVIVDRNNNIVTLPSSAGTFNYYPESEGIGHIDYDVDPWMDFGSGNGDNTTYDSRKSNSEWYYRNFLGEFSFGPNVDAIKTFNSTDEKQGRDK